MTDTTTSELGEILDRPRAVQNGMSQEEYDTWMFLTDKKALDEPYTFAIKQSDLTKFLQKYIRREDLAKLLPEKHDIELYKEKIGQFQGREIYIAEKAGYNKAIDDFTQTLNLVEENINE